VEDIEDVIDSNDADGLQEEAVLPPGRHGGRSALQSRFVETWHLQSAHEAGEGRDHRERVQYWLKKGAKPSDSVRTLLAKHVTRDLSAFRDATRTVAGAAAQ
jgi:ribosomal protein S16